ncbi:hypothetical protein JHK87_005773 [Glycine soja]|nr:hypothetical protein JHK87_005773 [Glycine soja]
MAYRRRHGISRASTFKEEVHPDYDDANDPTPLPSLSSSFSFTPSSSNSSSSLAAQAIKASAARLSKSGVWGVLAQKAKEILEDDKSSSPQHNDVINIMPPVVDIDKLKSHSFNTFAPPPQENNKTTRPDQSNQTAAAGTWNPWQPQPAAQTGGGASQTIHQTQLKASRDVAMATAAKAKLLLRELKTVKADLAFSKARCAQLEEENKMLRDRQGTDKGQNVTRADDDLIRLQLETLLAEKGRLASENEVYARENRFLREIVEYHQLTMQDVVYLDEGMEEVTELYPLDATGTAVVPRLSPKSPRSPLSRGGSQTKSFFSVPQIQEEEKNVTSESSFDEAPPSIIDSKDHPHAK